MNRAVDRELFSTDFLETPDIETSSEDYALRFSGEIGKWFLRVQEQATLRLLAPFLRAKILDVGGGHGQLTNAFIQNGYQVTVLGSADVCRMRIQKFIDANLCSFDVGDILNLPYPDRAFDIVVSYRLLPHVTQWKQLIVELARVAQKAVIMDYPTVRSINYIAPALFQLKKHLEGNTRPFTCLKESDLLAVWKSVGFTRAERYAEFFFPMALHRGLKSHRFSSVIERICRSTGLTSLFGSPVILKLIREHK